MNIKKCDDVTCFSDDHYTCPKCYGIFHVESNYKFTLTKCKTVTCFDINHIYCPDCYCVIHVTIIKDSL